MIGVSQIQDEIGQLMGGHLSQIGSRPSRLKTLAAAAMMVSSVLLAGRPIAAQTAAPTTALKPTIQATLAGSPLPGVPGSYCWPQAGQPPCALVEDVQPPSFVPAKAGDVITFSPIPAGAPLASLVATFLDDPQADGKPLQIDLTATQGAYTVDAALNSGAHRIEIDAAYPALADGSQNYVAYIFGIQIGGTAVPTSSSVIASVPTTAAATLPASSPVAQNATAISTDVTTAAGTPGLSGSAPASSATSLPSATRTATVTATNTPTLTDSPTATDTATATDTSTATPTLTVTPSPTATSTDTSTATSTPTNTPTVTPSATPTSTGIALGNGLNIPKLAFMVGDKSFEPVAVTASIQDATGALITVTRPIDATSTLAHAPVATLAQFTFSGPKPISELATLQSGDASLLIAQQIIQPATTITYALPQKAGLYTLSMAVQWPQGSATYIYRILITG